MNEQLVIKGLTKSFGGVIANNAIDLTIGKGEIIGLIGPNGAGKSTLFNCIAGFHPPEQGMILFEGVEIQKMAAHQICKLGISRTFQIPRLFLDMTVLENVMVGAFLHYASRSEAEAKAKEILQLSGLSPKNQIKAASLTIADKKRLELSRAMATQPKLLMLDEVMAGLTRVEQEEAVTLVRKINGMGITIVLVEHVMEIVMPISSRVIVLDEGVKIAEDTPLNIVQNPKVIEAYLGEQFHAEHSGN